MKNLALATAIAATVLSSGAHAVVSSNITNIDLVVQGINIEVDCATQTWNSGFVTRLSLSGVGTTPTVGGVPGDEINFNGNVCLDVGGGLPFVALDFNLRGERVTAPPAAGPGTVFDRGNVDIYVDWGTGWVYYNSVNAAATPIACLDNGTTIAGIQWANPGVNNLPGPAVAPNLPVCETLLLGNNSALYLDGTNTD